MSVLGPVLEKVRRGTQRVYGRLFVPTSPDAARGAKMRNRRLPSRIPPEQVTGSVVPHPRALSGHRLGSPDEATMGGTGYPGRNHRSVSPFLLAIRRKITHVR